MNISDICNRPLAAMVKLNLGATSNQEALRLGLITRTQEALIAYNDKEQTMICIKKLEKYLND
jgi:hypothetical protein